MVGKIKALYTVLLTIACIVNTGLCSTNISSNLNVTHMSNASVSSSPSSLVSNNQTFSQSAHILSQTTDNSSLSASNISITESSVTWEKSSPYRIPYLAPGKNQYWRPWMTAMFGLMAVLLCFAVACILYFTNKQNTLGKVEPSKLNVDESFWNVPDGPTPPSSLLVPKKKPVKKNASPNTLLNLALSESSDTKTPTNILHSPSIPASVTAASVNTPSVNTPSVNTPSVNIASGPLNPLPHLYKGLSGSSGSESCDKDNQ